jgi:hypothetical protein
MDISLLGNEERYHYSLPRWVSTEFLGHANDQALGVKAMSPLFAVP